MNVKLIDFLATGKFGLLTLGDSKDNVIKLIGQPTDCSSEHIQDLIWKFEDVEITFGIDGIACIFFEINNSGSIFHKIDFEDLSLVKEMSFNDVKRNLENRNIYVERINYSDSLKNSGLAFFPNFVQLSFEMNKISSLSVCDPQKFI